MIFALEKLDTPRMPGFRIGYRPDNGPAKEEWHSEMTASDDRRLMIGSWLDTRFPRPKNTLSSTAYDGGGLSVYVDGYITNIGDLEVVGADSAAAVLDVYRRKGIGFLGDLRGSYSILIGDEVQKIAYLLNDRRGSRPVFIRRCSDGRVHFAPEVAELAALESSALPIAPVAVAQFMTFSSFLGEDTLFPSIKKLPQASLVVLTPERLNVSNYWGVRYCSEQSDSAGASMIEELDNLIIQAVRRLKRAAGRPFLFLSGGVDSRIVLGAQRTAGVDMPVAYYGNSEGDDNLVAETICKALRLRSQYFPIRESGFCDLFETASIDSDLRGETIDTPTIARVNRELGRQYGMFVNGDEAFGWHYAPVSRGENLTAKQAVHAVGLRDFSHTHRLREWFGTVGCSSVVRELRGSVEAEAFKARGELNADTMDNLYYQQRMGNMLNAFTAQRLRFMEQARPLLDEDVVEFLTRVPAQWRYNKKLARDLLETKYPDLARMPFSTKSSISSANTYRRLMIDDKRIGAFVRNYCCDELDSRLARILDVDAIRACINALIRGAEPPAVSMPWWARLPGVWRFRRVADEIPVVTLVLRLLQMNLYLRAITSGGR